MAIWVVVDVLSEPLVSRVSFDRDINSNSGFQVDDIVFQDFDLVFSVLQVLKKVKRLLVRLITLLLDRHDVVGGLENFPSCIFQVCEGLRVLLFQHRVLGCQSGDMLLLLSYLVLLLIDVGLLLGDMLLLLLDFCICLYE